MKKPLSNGLSSAGASSSSSRANRRHTYHSSPAWSPDNDEDDRLVSSSSTIASDYHELQSGTMDQAYAGDLDSDQGSGNIARSRSDPKLTDSVQRAVSESAPVTYRSVRSMKHKDRAYQEGMRKSNSMHDLSRSDMEHAAPEESLYRSRSRENLYGSFPKRRSVSANFSTDDCPDLSRGSQYSEPSSPSSTSKPKTLFETLQESLHNPEPDPKPKPKNSKYMRLASIPNTKTIENYVGSSPSTSPVPSPRRSKSLDRPTERRRESSPSPVATNRNPYRSLSSPRSKSTNSSAKTTNFPVSRSYIQTIRDKFQNMAVQGSPAPTHPSQIPWSRSTARSPSASSSSSGRFSDFSAETDAAKSAAVASFSSPPSPSTTARTDVPVVARSSVSSLAQQWNVDRRGAMPRNTSSSRTGRTSERRLHSVMAPPSDRNSACASPPGSLISPQHVSPVSGGTSLSPSSGDGSANQHHKTSKFVVRVPPPYRTAPLSSCPSYSLPRTPFIGQEPVAMPSRPLPRSLSAPSPARAKVSTDTRSRSPGRSLERGGRESREGYQRDPSTPSYILNGRTKNETDEHKVRV